MRFSRNNEPLCIQLNFSISNVYNGHNGLCTIVHPILHYLTLFHMNHESQRFPRWENDDVVTVAFSAARVFCSPCFPNSVSDSCCLHTRTGGSDCLNYESLLESEKFRDIILSIYWRTKSNILYQLIWINKKNILCWFLLNLFWILVFTFCVFSTFPNVCKILI